MVWENLIFKNFRIVSGKPRKLRYSIMKVCDMQSNAFEKSMDMIVAESFLVFFIKSSVSSMSAIMSLGSNPFLYAMLWLNVSSGYSSTALLILMSMILSRRRVHMHMSAMGL